MRVVFPRRSFSAAAMAALGKPIRTYVGFVFAKTDIRYYVGQHLCMAQGGLALGPEMDCGTAYRGTLVRILAVGSKTEAGGESLAPGSVMVVILIAPAWGGYLRFTCLANTYQSEHPGAWRHGKI